MASGNKELDPVLEERIAQAIEPVLADFKRQMAEAVQQQLASAQNDDPEIARPVAQTESRNGGGEAAGGPAKAPPPAAPSRDAGKPAETTSSASDAGPPPAQTDKGDENESILPLLRGVLGGLEHQGEEWLGSLIPTILSAVFSDTLRRTIRQQLLESSTELLDEVFRGLPPDQEDTEALQARSHQLMETLIDDMLQDLFDGSVRREVEYHAQEAGDALAQLDFQVAAQHGQDAIQALLLGILRALGRHWGEVARLLLKTVVDSLQGMFGNTVTGGLASLVLPTNGAEEKAQAVQEQFEEKANELGERLREATGTLRERIAEQTAELQRRLQEGVKGQGHQLGRPPTGRVLGRPPSTRAPSGRAPYGRPPSRNGQGW